MRLDDIKFYNVTYDLRRSPELRNLIKRLLRLRYRSAHRRYVRDGEGTVYDLEELERQHKIVMDADLLDWTKHGPEPGSVFEFIPGGLKLRLPPARRGEDVDEFLTRLIRKLKAELEGPDSTNSGTKVSIDLSVGDHLRDG